MLANRVRNFTRLRWDEFIKYEHFINFKFQKERAALFINADSLRLFCASQKSTRLFGISHLVLGEVNIYGGGRGLYPKDYIEKVHMCL